MNGNTFLYFSCIIAGFALIRIPLSGALTPLEPFCDLIGVVTVLLFSCIIIFNGIMSLIGRRKL
ncbi:hypothetical protein [Pontibacillus sp. HMF3514]|uniref:hypothetical protein n=1 Tax=Pontibacillus sp. HMF3514 TaxID=2692425 RepID=UPI00131FF0AB|nr:hypothetical protein [Pontibacillus sp. HMF3514]QHE51038.1 hypothetical protein GS400_02820 [Pontibacillus sp. HMF3514]